jgi:hypothetical protein
MVRYYGYYSNVTRGKRRKRAEEDAVPYIIESDRSPVAYRKNWARLIQKITEVDPLSAQWQADCLKGDNRVSDVVLSLLVCPGYLAQNLGGRG